MITVARYGSSPRRPKAGVVTVARGYEVARVVVVTVVAAPGPSAVTAATVKV
jgi:hypothetical protein